MVRAALVNVRAVTSDINVTSIQRSLASSSSLSKELILRSESATESESLDSEIERLIRHFGCNCRTGRMSNPNIVDPNDESWLEMPLNITPLQAIGPDPQVIDIEDDSPDEASVALAESEDAEETQANEADEADEANEDVDEIAEGGDSRRGRRRCRRGRNCGRVFESCCC
ncbi:hypothetical protein RHMOL_Rhmol12G0050300 [Rhododendron molle]|uniref:Uncharacterized protein n=1 Tax=Rhododendron molle TaxID=49168 RepID=A0ACC0LEW1_RHOML|nr:hypothetical protein RHMOL_Rhmol12G0050300 [Rhododendron molle]